MKGENEEMKRRELVLVILMCFAIAILQTSPDIGHAQAGTSVLTVTSGLPNQGGMNPLAGATVALLNESLESILRKSHAFDGQPSILKAWHTACVNRSPLCRKGLEQLEDSVVTNGQMDATGKTTLSDVPAGSYYLMTLGLSVQSAQGLVWDLKVDLKPGPNSVTLNEGNMISFDLRAARQDATASAPPSTSTAGTAEPNAAMPSGPKNSVLTLSATDGPQKPVTRTAFYLLDDDFEKILQRAGFKQQMLLGKPLPLLNSFEFVARMVALKKNDPRFALLEGLSGESLIPREVEQQYNLGVQALSQHIVATAKTNAGGRAILPAVPAGTYYLYGTTSEFVKVGDVVTVDRRPITPTVTNSRPYGYDSATIWNMKVTINSGRNSVALTRANAVFVTGR